MAMTRRKFLLALLGGASALAVHAATPSKAALFSGAVWSEPFYYGNPNVNFTTLDASAGIASWPEAVAGVVRLRTPGFLHVSAANVTGDGSLRPWEDAEYRWNFGDADDRQVKIIYTQYPYTGNSFNANRDQIGPEGFYKYAVPGTYTVYLYCRAKTASGPYLRAVAQLTVIVEDFDNTSGQPVTKTYFKQGTGNTRSGTGTISDPYNLGGIGTYDPTDLNNALANANTHCYIAKGSAWTSTQASGNMINVTASKIRISAWDSGDGATAAPSFYLTATGAGSANTINAWTSGLINFDDLVISGIEGVLGGTGNGVFFFQQALKDGQFCTNLYLDECTFRSDGTVTTGNNVCFVHPTSANVFGGIAFQGTGRWGCTIIAAEAAGLGTNFSNIDGYGAQTWAAWAFTTITGNCKIIIIDGDNKANTHLCNPETCDQHVIFLGTNINGTCGNNAINGNSAPYRGPLSQYYVVSYCNLGPMPVIPGVTGTSAQAIDLSNTNTDNGAPQTVTNMVWDGAQVTVTLAATAPSSWVNTSSVCISDVTPSTMNRQVRLAGNPVGSTFKYNLTTDPGSYVSGGIASTGQFYNTLVQFTCIHDIGVGSTIASASLKSITLRYNLLWNNESFIGLGSILGPYFGGSIYGNNVYTPVPINSSSAAAAISLGLTTYVNPIMISDNTFWDDRTVNGSDHIIDIAVCSQIGAGSAGGVIDRNKYYHPRYANAFQNRAFGSCSASQTWAGWQAAGADPNGTDGIAPAWPNPAAGQFS